MPKQPTPWFRKNRGWHIQLNGKKIFLGHDREKAFREFHRLMAGNPAQPSLMRLEDLRVVSVLDAYLDWLQNRVREGSKAQRTFDWYQGYLQDFANFGASTSRIQDLTIAQLEPIHVYQWADSHPGWKTGKRGAIVAVQRAFNWAGKAGLLRSIGGRSPLASIEKPQPGRRERIVTVDEYREVLAVVRDQEFQYLVELSWETGCRPHELFTVEASFADLETARWVFPIRLSKGKKVQRVVYLSERALEITRRLVTKHPSGLLLRNTEGAPWSVSSAKCRFQQICRLLGRRRLKAQGRTLAKIPRLTVADRQDSAIRSAHNVKVRERRQQMNELARQNGIRLNLYAFRHSLITESLVSGLDAVTVSILAGHQDINMIARHYAHLNQKHSHMRDAANRVRGSDASA
jgi:integrase